MLSPPAGSAVSVLDTPSGRLVTIPVPGVSASRYFPIAFLAFWLCGWLTGEISVFQDLLASGWTKDSPFLLVWLCGWTVGGAFAVFALVRMLRPGVPETILMTASGLTVDSGLRPANPSTDAGWKRNASWSKRRAALFPRRTVTTVDRRSLETLRLREGDSRNRLTLDLGAQRMELAETAGDIEREWLFRLISERYRLRPQEAA